MTTIFNQGDKVEWSVGTGTAIGTVQRKITKRTELNDQTVDASEDNPRYFVENDNTGNVTSHKSETLSLKDRSSQSNLEVGDRVKWNTAQGETTGTIEEKLTEPIQIKNYDVKASDEDPKYLVESEQTGSEAAHNPDALKKL